MPKKEKPAKSSTSAKASTKTEATSKVVANERLVAAIRESDALKEEYASSLVKISEIYEEEQLTRAELVASLMEARGIEKSSADSQVSRMFGYLKKPEVMEQLRAGEITVRAANKATARKQTNPNKEKQKEAIEKRYQSALSKLIEAAKDGGYDRATCLEGIRAAFKDAGIK